MDLFLHLFVYFLLQCLAYCYGSDHPCYRKCEVGQNRLCEYHFVVENYYVLSRACHNCPFNKTDCFRPHCVSANGLKKNLLTVNRQLPGTAIQVCKGDTVSVRVQNQMDDGQSTSIHWHGLYQRNSIYMDGVARLTQCSIGPGETFHYEFVAENAGTHWWHSHTGVQVGDGLFGAFIVREPLSMDPSAALYHEDRSDHVVILSAWADVPEITRYMEEMQDTWNVPIPINVIINGRGKKYLVKDFITADKSLDPEPTPNEVFTVSSNKTYRFRVIVTSSRCHFRLMVDGHRMTVIASDGKSLSPETVGSVIIHPGERYDFLLTADAEPGNYWMKVQGFGDCNTADNTTGNAAILHYQDEEITSSVYEQNITPKGDMLDYQWSDTVLNPTPKMLMDGLENTNTVIKQLQLRNDAIPEENFENETVDLRYYMHLKFQSNDNSYYGNKDYYPQSVRGGLLTPTINNITFYHHTLPMVTQWDDIKDKRFCNMSTINTVTDCNDDLCHCVHMLDVKLGQVVELFMVNTDLDIHPMHLHGHHFRVVGSGWIHDFLEDEELYKTVTLQQVIEQDKNGLYQRILRNPLYKDTIPVHTRAGYSIVRFKAMNPGLWFFHCHTEGHLMQGMALVIKAGDPEDFPKPKDDFPVCGVTRKSLQRSFETSGFNHIIINHFLVVALLVRAVLCRS